MHAKQQQDESLLDCTKQFKQAKDMFVKTVGKDTLNAFVEHAQEHKDAQGDTTKQSEIKDAAFDKWMSCLCMRNSDQDKHGTLLKGFRSQCSLGNNQHPATMTGAGDALTNHAWDEAHNKKKKNQREQQKAKKEERSDQNKNEEKQDEKTESSFRQQDGKLICCCCGKEGHACKQCKDKDKIPRNQWAMHKGVQMSQGEQNKDKEEEKETVDTEKEKEAAKMKKVEWKDKDGNNGTGWMGFQGLQRCAEPCCEQECNCTQQTDGDDDFDEAKSFMSDTGSAFNSSNNEELLTGVSRGKKAIQMNANAGSRIVKCDRTDAWHGGRNMVR